jgi:hypothetical protein
MAETLATYTVPESHVKMYTANVQAALVKKGSILRPTISQGSYMGEKAQVVSFLGPIEFVERNTPYADTKVSEIEHTQRWINGNEYDCAVYVDRLDTLKMIFDPTSPYVERMREAAARKEDEIIMSGFFASAKTGKDGTTSTSYKTTNVVAHGSAGMSVAKLRALKKLIKKRHIDTRMVKPFIAVTADEVDALLGETSVGSSDYNAVKALVDGEVGYFMGFTFVPYEDNGGVRTLAAADGKSIPYALSSTTHRMLPCWVPDGMHVGDWEGFMISIDKLPTKNYVQQAFATFTKGRTRLEENKVFGMECLIPS